MLNTFFSDLKPKQWTDPGLGWDTSVYQFDEVVLPVSKVWTPEIHVTNGLVSHIAPLKN